MMAARVEVFGLSAVWSNAFAGALSSDAILSSVLAFQLKRRMARRVSGGGRSPLPYAMSHDYRVWN